MTKSLPDIKELRKDFKTAEQLVAFCLKNFPETRNNDRTLMLKVWELQGFRLPKKLINFFYRILSPESIRRTRQKIQARGLFLPSNYEVAKRSLLSMEYRELFKTNKS